MIESSLSNESNSLLGYKDKRTQSRVTTVRTFLWCVFLWTRRLNNRRTRLDRPGNSLEWPPHPRGVIDFPGTRYLFVNPVIPFLPRPVTPGIENRKGHEIDFVRLPRPRFSSMLSDAVRSRNRAIERVLVRAARPEHQLELR